MKATEINIDITQLFDGFHKERDKNVITEEQHEEILDLIRSQPSYGEALNGRLIVSYSDFSNCMITFPKYFNDARKFAMFYENICKYAFYSMLIHS